MKRPTSPPPHSEVRPERRVAGSSLFQSIEARYSLFLFGATVIALLTLVALIRSLALQIRAPDIGFAWYGSGRVVYRVDPEGPAAGRISPGEAIHAIDGYVPVSTFEIVGLRGVGDVISFEVRTTEDSHRIVAITTQAPSLYQLLFRRLTYPLIAIAFWVSSLAVIGLERRRWMDVWDGVLYFSFSQLMALVFIWVGEDNLIFDAIDKRYVVTCTWLGLAGIHLHLRFPKRWVTFRTSLITVILSCIPGLVITVIDLADPVGWGTPTRQLVATYFLMGALATVLCLLILTIVRPTDTATRKNTRLLVASALLAYAPSFWLNGQIQVLRVSTPSDFLAAAEALAAIIPVAYAYAILRYRLIRYDGAVSRAVGYLVAVLVLVMFLITAISVLLALGVAPTSLEFSLGLGALAVGLVVLFEPARLRIQRVVDDLFVREYDDFRSTLRGVDHALAVSPEVATWAETLCGQFANALDLRLVGLLHRLPQGNTFRLAAHDPAQALRGFAPEWDAVRPPLAQLSTWTQPGSTQELRAAVEQSIVNLTEAERNWLTGGAIDLWWPILVHGHLQAVLVLGRKSTAYSAEEVELIALSSRQIGFALENAQFTRELEQLSRAALQTRDEERKRVSRELHDHIIQPLVGLNFTLAAARDVPAAAEARAQIVDLITHIRRISSDLRPPALDEVGLPAAARGLIRGFARQHPVVVDFTVLPDEDLEIPEPLASAFFSALRESLNNVAKHAQAGLVRVRLEALAGELSLIVHDDGQGFSPPPRLRQLAPAGHFGLVGIQERLADLGGSLKVHAEPGQGTRIECRAPLKPRDAG
ncbi:MAG: sensor histidine kinase [Anaerolineales bacterium]|nr:sensor histidine kinase [Anaerolineales bacterium]